MLEIIEIDPSAGYCFGVEKAIETAEQNLKEGIPIYGLGSMVHNEKEIERLHSLGLKTINIKDLEGINEGKIIFRAHGEPPSTYVKTAQLKLEIIDATCPIVLKLQKKIRKKFLELNPDKEQIVLFGKKDHPETIGLLGQTENTAVLITDPDKYDMLDPSKSIFLYSQTTMDPVDFEILENNLGKLAKIEGRTSLNSNCTICNQMRKRKPELKKFAEKYEKIFFLSGDNSSNGKMLYEYCKSVNPATTWVHKPEDITLNMIKKNKSIGISGATSTSVWQLEQVKSRIESLTRG